MAHKGNVYPYVDPIYRIWSSPTGVGKGVWYLPARWDCLFAEGQGPLSLWSYFPTKKTSAPAAIDPITGDLVWVFPTYASGGVDYYVKFGVNAPRNGSVWVAYLQYYSLGIDVYLAEPMDFTNGNWFLGTNILNTVTGTYTGVGNSAGLATRW